MLEGAQRHVHVLVLATKTSLMVVLPSFCFIGWIYLTFNLVSVFPSVMITMLCIETGVEIRQLEKSKQLDVKE